MSCFLWWVLHKEESLLHFLNITIDFKQTLLKIYNPHSQYTCPKRHAPPRQGRAISQGKGRSNTICTRECVLHFRTPSWRIYLWESKQGNKHLPSVFWMSFLAGSRDPLASKSTSAVFFSFSTATCWLDICPCRA